MAEEMITKAAAMPNIAKTDKPVKLKPVQRRVLTQTTTARETHVIAAEARVFGMHPDEVAYRHLISLLKLGLVSAERHPERRWIWLWTATEAGRAALSEADHG